MGRLEEPVMSKTFIFLVAILFVLTIVQVKPYSDPPKKGEDAGEEDMETTTEPWDEDEPDAGERKKRESPKKEEEDMESTTEPWNDGDYGDEEEKTPRKKRDAGEEDMETTTEPTADEDKPDAGEEDPSKKEKVPKSRMVPNHI